MTATRTDPDELGYDIVAALAVECAPPAHLTTLAQQLAFYRAAASSGVPAAVPDDAGEEYLAEALSAASAEVGYVYAQAAGRSVAGAAMVDTTATDYFGGPLSSAELARLKRAATAEAKRLARAMLAEPLDPTTNDATRFAEGIEMEEADRGEGYSKVSQAVHDEVTRIVTGWETGAA